MLDGGLMLRCFRCFSSSVNADRGGNDVYQGLQRQTNVGAVRIGTRQTLRDGFRSDEHRRGGFVVRGEMNQNDLHQNGYRGDLDDRGELIRDDRDEMVHDDRGEMIHARRNGVDRDDAQVLLPFHDDCRNGNDLQPFCHDENVRGDVRGA